MYNKKNIKFYYVWVVSCRRWCQQNGKDIKQRTNQSQLGSPDQRLFDWRAKKWVTARDTNRLFLSDLIHHKFTYRKQQLIEEVPTGTLTVNNKHQQPKRKPAVLYCDWFNNIQEESKREREREREREKKKKKSLIFATVVKNWNRRCRLSIFLFILGYSVSPQIIETSRDILVAWFIHRLRLERKKGRIETQEEKNSN